MSGELDSGSRSGTGEPAGPVSEGVNTVFDVAILAGGRSTRMGFDKALLVVEGRTLLERQVALAWSLGPREVWVAGRTDTELAGWRARGVSDAQPGQGPLGGLAAVLEIVDAPHVLVLAVDMPALTEAFLRRLLAVRAPGVGVVPRTRRGWEAVAAVYPRELAPLVRAALVAGRRAMHSLVEEGVAAGLLRAWPVATEEEGQLINWNRPQDVVGVGPTSLP